MTWVFVAITLVKLAVASQWGWTNDIPQTLTHAEAFLAGRHDFSPFNAGHIRTIFPLGYYFFACVPLLMAQWTGISYAFWIKVPAILSDLLIALLLKATPKGGDHAAFLYIMSPVTFLLSVYHGQLHTVATAGAVLALWCANRSRWGLAGLTLALGASVRQHVAVLIVLLLKHPGSRRLAVATAFVLTVFLTNVTLWSGYHGKLAAPVWIYGSWGYAMLLFQGPRVLTLMGLSDLAPFLEGVNQALHTYGPALHWLWAVAFSILVWRRPSLVRDPDGLWRSALLFLVGLYTITPGFGVQWLIWALPFWLVVNRRAAMVYSALAGGFLIGTYWQTTLNATYRLDSVTANLRCLSAVDLAGVLLVGAVGLLTWAYCGWTTWRLAQS